MAKGYSELPNEGVGAANGITYAYRDTGADQNTVPLVLLQHFRGNLRLLLCPGGGLEVDRPPGQRVDAHVHDRGERPAG
jgi:hypothetical protein